MSSVIQNQKASSTRSSITFSQRLALRREHAAHPYKSYQALQEWFEATYGRNISASIISRTLSSRYDHLDSSTEKGLCKKRINTEKWPELENALFQWILSAQGRITISQDVIRTKAQEYWARIYPGEDTPQFSNGWLRNFQSRKEIKGYKLSGESGDVNQEAVETQMTAIRHELREYRPQDIFNCDESGLFWRAIPDRSLATTAIPGRKRVKSRITAHFCCNSDGSERLPIMFINNAKTPRSFAGAKIHINNLDCEWHWNRTAWMTTEIFKEWLLNFDRSMAGRKVVLLMDNFAAHDAAVTELGGRIVNTKVIWLPPNATSRCQPLDQGIIQAWKLNWKRRWVQYMLREFDAGRDPIETMTVLQAVRWGITCWESDVRPETIRRCFDKGLRMEANDDDCAEERSQEAANDIAQGLAQLGSTARISELMSIDQFLNPEEELVQDDVETLDEQILSQYQPATEEDEGEDEPPNEQLKVPVEAAMQSIACLRLYEEQQEQANLPFLRSLKRYERELLPRQSNSSRQCDIRSFFNHS